MKYNQVICFECQEIKNENEIYENNGMCAECREKSIKKSIKNKKRLVTQYM